MERKAGEGMDEDFFSERLSKLRMAKGVSARDMSLSVGQSPNYINKIENRKAFPSMGAFFFICEYLNITPKEFFDDGNAYPEKVNMLVADLVKLDERALDHIAGIVKEILGNK